MLFPMSIYPQSKPLNEGLYLVYDATIEKWKVSEWRNEYTNNKNGGWQGNPDVAYFIPYRLLNGNN